MLVPDEDHGGRHTGVNEDRSIVTSAARQQLMGKLQALADRAQMGHPSHMHGRRRIGNAPVDLKADVPLGFNGATFSFKAVIEPFERFVAFGANLKAEESLAGNPGNRMITWIGS